MCDLWKTKEREIMQPKDYRRLPLTLQDINISGGEPFLREDVDEIVNEIHDHNPRARIGISTNGFLPKRIEEQVKRMWLGVSIRVSIDGVGEAHDLVRGIPSGFDKCVETLERLRRIGIKDLGIGITCSSYNSEQILAVQDYAKRHDLKFNVQVAHDSPSYYGDHPAIRASVATIKPQVEAIIHDNFNSNSPREWGRGLFHIGLVELMEKQSRLLSCRAGEQFFYLDPYGNVFGCLMRGDLKMGNLLEQKWQEIFCEQEEVWNAARQCAQCWMICSSKPVVHTQPIKVIKTIMSSLVRYRLMSALKGMCKSLSS
ncbi:MAG: radical SAM protein [Mojavia pulchra JT2-VF2]|jgi:MoaA/NifB/PqqE/SkfB family radical SAM enzyme|uniref:Radical SAM protein n=1 Tax=Mojavia pulchra JT2-VF2 TaxID=287848 RepID=A0A951Q5P2_9NOST|nr:radical SAM protein [Mojavia pulchra JT2-VF2]